MRRLAPSSLRLHQLADLVPEMPSQQWTGFVGDVAERGILTPLVLAADGRTVLDGRHRLKAALELGLAQVPTTVADLEGRTEVDYMVRSALHRRHLTDDQRAILASRAAEERGDDRRSAASQTAANSRWHPDASGSPATTTHEPPRSREEVARSFGVATRKVRQAHGLRVVAPELADKVLAGDLKLKEADVLWRRRCQLEAIRALPEPALDERAQILLGDFRQLSKEIEADSVDMILTDPPYTHVALPLWEDLGELAARILRPGGFLVAYTGHMYLDEVMTALSRHLSYWWLCCIPFRGPKPSVHDRQVRTGFRTVLVYVKPPIGERPWFFDVVDGDRAPDKRFHDWGQSVKPARYFVSRFSSPGDLVLDPFCGAGAFPEAAVLEGRRTLGMEVHPAHVEVSRKRVGLALAGAPLQNPSGTDGGGGEGQDEDRTLRAAIYARCSTRDRDQNPQTQLLPLRDYVLAQGWEAGGEYVDLAPAGDLAARSQWRALIDQAARRKVDVILVFRIDRAFRSVLHAAQTLERLQGWGVGLRSYSEPWLDTTSPFGEALFHITAAYAQLERAVLAERVRAGIDRVRREGKPIGRPRVETRPSFRRRWPEVRERLRQGALSKRRAAKELGIGMATLSRLLGAEGAAQAGPGMPEPEVA